MIDGNEEHQILSVTALGRRGFRVTSADSGKEGLRLAVAQPFDAIVLGHKLRDTSGIEVLRLLAQRLPDTPKIFVVSADAEEAALRAMESGAHSYIVKTPRYNELLPAMVEEHIEEAENRRRLAETERQQERALTERRTLEGELSLSEARLRMVVEQAPMILWTTDRDLRVTSATGAGLLHLDLSKESRRGATLFEYFGTEDRDIEPIASHLRALAGESVHTEVEFLGRTYDVHIEPLRAPDGEAIGTLGVAFDVSERKRDEDILRRSQERFELLRQATRDVVWDWDLATDGQWTNENVRTLFGYSAEDVEPTSAWWLNHIHPGDRERVERTVRQAIRGGQRFWSEEYRFQRRDGSYAHVVERAAVIYDDSNRAIRAIGSVTDVTKERRADAIQRAVYRISEAAHTAKDLPELYREIHKVISGLMPAQNFYIALHEPESDTLSFPYFIDEAEPPPPLQKLGKGLTEYVLRTGRALLASPDVFDELVRTGEVISVGPPSIDWLGAPLVTQGKTIGVIVVQSYREGVRFSQEDKAILNFVSEQVAMAIERSRASEALRLAAGSYRLLFESNPQPMWVFDRETLRFLAVNDAAIRHYGYSREEFLSMTIKDIRPAEDVPRLLSELPKGTGVFYEAEGWRHRTKDGRTLDVKIRANPMAFDGRPAHLVVVTDLTEQRRAEAAQREMKDTLAALFQASPVAIISLERDGKVMSWNPAAERIFGWTAAEVIGRPLPTIPEERIGETIRMRETVLEHGALFGVETQRRRKDGRLVDVSVSSAPLRDEDGSVHGMVAVFQDLSQRKEMERRLIESERLATMGQLAGFVAHELNTPLTSISLLASAIGRRVKDEAVHEKLEKLNTERRRAAGIIQELLSLSKHGGLMRPKETDLRALVEAAAGQARAYRKKGVKLRVELGERPMPAVVDASHVQEVVFNLLKNALEATERGHVLVRLEDRSERVAISVEDTGTGITEEVRSHLFEPFFTTKPRGQGIGLGLLLSRNIVTAHGGTIEVSSEPGRGSTFTVLLPREGRL